MTFRHCFSAYMFCLFTSWGAHATPPPTTPLDPLLDVTLRLGASLSAVQVARKQAQLLHMTLGHLKSEERLSMAKLLSQGCGYRTPDQSLLDSLFQSNDPTLVATALRLYAFCNWKSLAITAAFERWVQIDDREVSPALAAVVGRDISTHLAWALQLENSKHYEVIPILIFSYASLTPEPVAHKNLLRMWDKNANKRSILFRAYARDIDLEPFFLRLKEDLVEGDLNAEPNQLYNEYKYHLDFQKARKQGKTHEWVTGVLLKGARNFLVTQVLSDWDHKQALDLVDVLRRQYPVLANNFEEIKKELHEIKKIQEIFNSKNPGGPKPREVLTEDDFTAFSEKLKLVKQRTQRLTNGQIGGQPPGLGVAFSGSFGKGYWKASSDGDLVVLCPRSREFFPVEVFKGVFHLDPFAGDINCTPHGLLKGTLERIFSGAVLDSQGLAAPWVLKTVKALSDLEFEALRKQVQLINTHPDPAIKMANRLAVPESNRWLFELLLQLWSTPRDRADLLEPFDPPTLTL